MTEPQPETKPPPQLPASRRPAGPSSARLFLLATIAFVWTAASPGVHAGLGELLRQYDVNEYAASVKVFAIKPRT